MNNVRMLQLTHISIALPFMVVMEQTKIGSYSLKMLAFNHKHCHCHLSFLSQVWLFIHNPADEICFGLLWHIQRHIVFNILRTTAWILHCQNFGQICTWIPTPEVRYSVFFLLLMGGRGFIWPFDLVLIGLSLKKNRLKFKKTKGCYHVELISHKYELENLLLIIFDFILKIMGLKRPHVCRICVYFYDSNVPV